jgi:alpha-amylase
VGYGIYDSYDLGEFDQKGTVRTKYGTKDEYLSAIQAMKSTGMQVYADVVMNHLLGADGTVKLQAKKVNPSNRNQVTSGTFEIEAFVKFDYAGRAGKYSTFKWQPFHFNGVDWDQSRQEPGSIYLLEGVGKKWNAKVSTENGNYDYLMGANLDYDHPETKQAQKDWGVWYTNFAQLDGFRLDAVKHIDIDFLNEFMFHVRSTTQKKDFFAVGEYWTPDLGVLDRFTNEVNDGKNNRMSLFDAPLHYRFAQASKSGGNFDMGSIFENTLVKIQPSRAVTLVENHDTQPLQALESPVDDWFKPIAYSLILLNQDGYPCVFYADYFGAKYTDKGGDGKPHDIVIKSQKPAIDKLLKARKDFAYETQRNYFDHRDVVGLTRQGTARHPGGLALLVSDGPGGKKRMELGKENAGKCYRNMMNESSSACVTLDENGFGEFSVDGGSVSVWVTSRNE